MVSHWTINHLNLNDEFYGSVDCYTPEELSTEVVRLSQMMEDDDKITITSMDEGDEDGSYDIEPSKSEAELIFIKYKREAYWKPEYTTLKPKTLISLLGALNIRAELDLVIHDLKSL